MSESMQDALAGVLDQLAPSEGSTYTRIPDHVMAPGVPDCLRSFIGGLVKLSKGKLRFKATDREIGEKLGKSPKSVNALFRMAERFGFVLRIGKTINRAIVLLFRFLGPGEKAPETLRAGAESGAPGLSAPARRDLPSGAENSPSKRGELSAPARDHKREMGDPLEKAPASSSSPGAGDTTTPAETKREEPPPSPAPPPPSEAESRWDALPESERVEIRARVVADNPALAELAPRSVDALARPLCVAALESRQPVATPPAPVPVVVVKVKPPRAEVEKAGATSGRPPTRDDILDARDYETTLQVRDHAAPGTIAHALAAMSLVLHDRAVRAFGPGVGLPAVPERTPAGEPPKGLPAGS